MCHWLQILTFIHVYPNGKFRSCSNVTFQRVFDTLLLQRSIVPFLQTKCRRVSKLRVKVWDRVKTLRLEIHSEWSRVKVWDWVKTPKIYECLPLGLNTRPSDPVMTFGSIRNEFGSSHGITAIRHPPPSTTPKQTQAYFMVIVLTVAPSGWLTHTPGRQTVTWALHQSACHAQAEHQT